MYLSRGFVGRRQAAGAPRVVATSEIHHFIESGALEQTTGDRAAITALAVHRNRACGIQLVEPGCKLIQRQELGARDVARFPLRRAADIDNLDIAHLSQFLRGNLPDLHHRVSSGSPIRHSVAQTTGYALDSDACQPQPRFRHRFRIFGDQDNIVIQSQQGRGPGSILARKRDVDGARNVAGAKLLCGTGIQNYGSGSLPRFELIRG